MILKTNIKIYALSAAIALAISAPVNAGLTFNLTPVNGTSDINADMGFQAAADFWSDIFTDDITVNIDTNFTIYLPSSDLGRAKSEYLKNATFAATKLGLTADQTSADDAIMVAGLPSGSVYSRLINGTTDGIGAHLQSGITKMRLTRANAKSIGLITDPHNKALDAEILMNKNLAWDYDRSDGISSGHYDFVGVAIHELGHAMGFESGVDSVDHQFGRPVPDSDYDDNTSLLDFTRCSGASEAAGADMDFTAGTDPKNFAINGSCSGVDLVTNAWSTGIKQGDGNNSSHWKDDLGLGIMDPSAEGPGGFNIVTGFDIQAFDVIGWDTRMNTSVPEPGIFSLLSFGFLTMAIGVLRRRKNQTV